LFLGRLRLRLKGGVGLIFLNAYIWRLAIKWEYYKWGRVLLDGLSECDLDSSLLKDGGAGGASQPKKMTPKI